MRLPNFAFSEVTWKNLTTKVDAMDNKPVFISATDGNHGYGLAFAAKLLGCPCIIYMPVASISLLIITHVKDLHNSSIIRCVLQFQDTVEQRVNRIKKLGADVRVLQVNYDETVFEALEETKRTSEKHLPVQFIQDTTLDDYFVSFGFLTCTVGVCKIDLTYGFIFRRNSFAKPQVYKYDIYSSLP